MFLLLLLASAAARRRRSRCVAVAVAVVEFTCFYLIRFLILRNVKHSVDAFILMRFARVFIIFFFVDIIDCHFFFVRYKFMYIHTAVFFITLCVVLHSEKSEKKQQKNRRESLLFSLGKYKR